MSELVLRGHHNDHLVMTELLDPASLPIRSAQRIRRVVVDATAAASTGQFSRAALDSGTQYLIDPLTPLLLDRQDPRDRWARLSFATPGPVPLSELFDARWRRRKVAEVIQFQLEHGASAIIPPYLHIDRADGPLAEAQLELWNASTSYLRDEGLGYAMVPVLSIDRNPVALEMNAWELGLGRLLRAGAGLTDEPVALALSGSSAVTAHSLHKMSQIWRRAASITDFIAWHAGDVGPIAVALGAAGYEVGMCSTERCDVNGEMRNRRPSNNVAGPRWTGVYIDALGRSLGKREVAIMSQVRSLQGDLACFDSTCCPRGFDSLLGATRRQHAARCRLRDLADLDAITARAWRLHRLERTATEGLGTARRLRHYADVHGLRVGAYPAEFDARQKVLQGLRATARVAVA